QGAHAAYDERLRGIREDGTPFRQEAKRVGEGHADRPARRPLPRIHNWNEGVWKMKIRPLHDQVFVKRLEDETFSKGGIVIPEVAQKRNMMAEVVAFGPGKVRKDGMRQKPSIEPGSKVLLAKYDGTPLTVGDETFIILREGEILAEVA